MQKETRRNSAAGSAKPNPPRKLTRAEKKQIAEIIRQAKGDGKAHTAQQTIPYIQMYPDGICKVTEKKYSKSIAYDDTSIEKLISGWVASHAEVNLAKRYLEVTLTNIFQDIDMLPTVNYNVNALPMRRIGQH